MTHRGWFLHFVDWETGSNYKDMSEYATSDTANFIAGALYAGQVFGGEIKAIADDLYREVNFDDMRTDGGTHPEKLWLSLSFRAEDGKGKKYVRFAQAVTYGVPGTPGLQQGSVLLRWVPVCGGSGVSERSWGGVIRFTRQSGLDDAGRG